MKISEIYRSVQGEGLLTGTPSVFVRTSGCNLRCWFCDTPYTSWYPEGSDMTVDEIIAHVQEWDCSHVVLTGGEPMLFAELIPLSKWFRSAGYHITIETSGTLYLPVVCDLMSISPKLQSSAPSLSEHPYWSRRHQRERIKLEVLRRLIDQFDYQLKFVVDRPADLEEIEQLLCKFPAINAARILMMPQGVEPEELQQRTTWLELDCQRRGFVFCPRKQIEWFGPLRRT